MRHERFGWRDWRPLTLAVVVLGLILVAGCGDDDGGEGAAGGGGSEQQDVVTLEAGCGDNKGFPVCDALDKLAEVVEEKSNGSLIIRNGYQAFGVEGELAQEVISGSVDIGNLGNSNAAAHTKAYLVFDLPFLFESDAAAFEVLDGPSGEEYIANFEEDTGTQVLLTTSFGVGRDIQTTDKQLKVPDDIKGLKIRTTESPVDLLLFRAWGANPTPTDFGQTFTALQQGVLDGENIAYTAILAAKHEEVIKYNIRLDYQFTFNQLIMNNDKFESLSPAHQKILEDAGDEVRPWQRDHEIQRAEMITEQLEEAGVKVYEPTDEERAKWTAVRDQVWTNAAEELDIDLDAARELSGATS